jgi:RNA polymerase sigma-70 factor (ECF subfamily)
MSRGHARRDDATAAGNGLFTGIGAPRIEARQHGSPVMTRAKATDAATDLAMLIARCALRDQAALLALYDATSAKLYGVILRIVQREHWAEEIMQDVYLKAWEAAGSYNTARGRAMTWLINIARNRAIDFLRGAEHSASQRSDEIDDQLTSALDPLRAADTDGAMDRLAACLRELKDGQRDCILMVYHQGYTPTEVAQRSSHPLGTVKTWIRRGLEQLRKCMRP